MAKDMSRWPAEVAARCPGWWVCWGCPALTSGAGRTRVGPAKAWRATASHQPSYRLTAPPADSTLKQHQWTSKKKVCFVLKEINIHFAKSILEVFIIAKSIHYSASVTWGLGFVSCLGFLVFYFDILPCFMFLSCAPCPSCDHVMCYSCL